MVGATRQRSAITMNTRLQRNTKGSTAKNARAGMVNKGTSLDENALVTNLKSKVAEKTKRANESSPKEAPAKKRSVFGDLTNASLKQQFFDGKKSLQELKKPTENLTAKTGIGRRTRSQENKPTNLPQLSEIFEDSLECLKDKSVNSSSFENISVCSLLSESEICKLSSDGLTSSQSTTSSRNVSIDEKDIPEIEKDEAAATEEFVILEVEKNLPEGVRDVDTDPDPFSVSEYAESIFKNMKAKEKSFIVKKYMEGRDELTPGMRGILIDWLVEVQENFELYHETLYLAVRIVDLYLQSKVISKQNLQLVGATAMLISAKIEERYPPPLDDFVFICDDAYKSGDFIKTELDILKILNFELGIPISYRFLRRFSRVAGADMITLTLARYILETSLLHYEYVDCSQSKIAAAALNLAFRMKNNGVWDKTLEYHSGYREADLIELVKDLNKKIRESPKSNLTTVHSKYSHPVFSEVAKIPKITIDV
ncbi:G2/mitotic-specific cyclin-B3-like [Rhopilema esculentum]|uniref:G2/mitotic-specific cyclin-B3-like n=1 Tax=Rhopilema esculentum TaxID=499914 RepID=UPI0031D8B1D1|eukprot:gene16315-7703_t